MTPLRLLELFFEDILVDIILGYTKLYGHTEKVEISFEVTTEKIRLFLSVLLLKGAISLQNVKCIGRQPPIILCKQGLILYV